MVTSGTELFLVQVHAPLFTSLNNNSIFYSDSDKTILSKPVMRVEILKKYGDHKPVVEYIPLS